MLNTWVNFLNSNIQQNTFEPPLVTLLPFFFFTSGSVSLPRKQCMHLCLCLAALRSKQLAGDVVAIDPGRDVLRYFRTDLFIFSEVW